MKLNPNCSETVWRLNGYTREGRNEFETDTSCTSFGEVLNKIINLIEEAKSKGIKIEDLEITEVENEGGSYFVIEEAFKCAVKIVKGKLTEEEAIKEFEGSEAG